MSHNICSYEKKGPTAIADYLNKHNILKKEIKARDIDISYVLNIGSNETTNLELFFFNIPSLGIKQGEEKREISCGPNYNFTCYSTIEPLVGKKIDSGNKYTFMTLSEAYEVFNHFIPSISPNCLEEAQYLLNNSYVGLWGYLKY